VLITVVAVRTAHREVAQPVATAACVLDLGPANSGQEHTLNIGRTPLSPDRGISSQGWVGKYFPSVRWGFTFNTVIASCTGCGDRLHPDDVIVASSESDSRACQQAVLDLAVPRSVPVNDDTGRVARGPHRVLRAPETRSQRDQPWIGPVLAQMLSTGGKRA